MVIASEIKEAKLTSPKRTFSFFFACVFLFLYLIFTIFTYIDFYKHKIQLEGRFKMSELYSGLKSGKWSRFYKSLWITRRLLFALLLILFPGLNLEIKLSIMAFFQLIYLCYIIIISPFKKIKHNLVEVSNEILLLCYIMGQFYFQQKKHWNGVSEVVCISMILVNNIYIFIVFLSKNGGLIII